MTARISARVYDLEQDLGLAWVRLALHSTKRATIAKVNSRPVEPSRAYTGSVINARFLLSNFDSVKFFNLLEWNVTSSTTPADSIGLMSSFLEVGDFAVVYEVPKTGLQKIVGTLTSSDESKVCLALPRTRFARLTGKSVEGNLTTGAGYTFVEVRPSIVPLGNWEDKVGGIAGVAYEINNSNANLHVSANNIVQIWRGIYTHTPGLSVPNTWLFDKGLTDEPDSLRYSI